MSTEIPKSYTPSEVEAALYAQWRERGEFRAVPNPDKPPWAVMMPLPNVTGELHIGHALNNTLQDSLTRFWRMRGFEVLYQPGTDHAGIATQNVVERQLAKENVRREDLGRDAFQQRVWEWVEKYGGIIYEQLQRLGISCDWDRKVFTLDPHYHDAVLDAFVRLYDKGLIYRGKYMVNWCPRCRTSISDLEVQHKDVDSFLWHVRYRAADGEGGVVIATQRPETILADVAVAVHPDDERYRRLIGRQVIVPIVDRPVPVIADNRVDPAFGTGALKITPGHDPTDYQIGADHKLPTLVVLDEDGKMNEEAGPFLGLERFDARERVADALDAAGVLIAKEPYRTSVGTCDRCATIIEPYISEQWFCAMKEMAARAADAIRDGKVRYAPERWQRITLDWLDNIRDWCISRQLWWGHRIPVYACADCGHRVAAKSAPAACVKCGSGRLAQDPDVLDTWFSSALWPLATLGWPQDTPDLRYFYPTSILITGRDIIFLWVARMIMFGLEFGNEVPYRDVYINPTVMDIQGRRMSKSLGTGIDPLQAIDKYGADALRFGLIVRCSQSQQDLRFEEKMIADTRNFANKLWNAARFVQMNLGEAAMPPEEPDANALTDGDRWILSRLQRVIDEVTRAYETYEFDVAARTLYQFLWNEYCDWYLETAKVQLGPASDAASRAGTRWVLWRVLTDAMKLLHPIMPFLTEVIWKSFVPASTTIAREAWPVADPARVNEAAERDVAWVHETIRVIRSLRADVRLTPQQDVALRVVAPPAERAWLDAARPLLRGLARAGDVTFANDPPPGPAAIGVVGPAEIHVPLSPDDAAALAERTRKDLAALETDAARARARLDNPEFRDRAPAEIVAQERQRLADADARRSKLERTLRGLGA
ncbi:MAG: valine--tRNA ligase [Armatimonadetes bacterium]|nr:valine--tRNA ligase [Armatimonadota bacterium]